MQQRRRNRSHPIRVPREAAPPVFRGPARRVVARRPIRAGLNLLACVCDSPARGPWPRPRPGGMPLKPEATMGRVLVVGSDQETLDTLAASADMRGHEVSACFGEVEALLQLRRRAVDVVVTHREAPFREGLALARELAEIRPGVRIIVLAPAATRDELVAALRAHVFACFTPPFDEHSIVEMVRAALHAPGWRDGIEVVSGMAHWLTLKVSCHLLTAERLVRFMTEHQAALVEHEGDLLMIAFREMLLNAMEHGAGFDPEKVIEVTAARTARTIVYHFRDPGSGFDRADLAHAASSSPEDVLTNAQRRAEAGLRPGGFGMLIARQVADELVYNERGNEVLLIKHLI